MTINTMITQLSQQTPKYSVTVESIKYMFPSAKMELLNDLRTTLWVRALSSAYYIHEDDPDDPKRITINWTDFLNVQDNILTDDESLRGLLVMTREIEMMIFNQTKQLAESGYYKYKNGDEEEKIATYDQIKGIWTHVTTTDEAALWYRLMRTKGLYVPRFQYFHMVCFLKWLFIKQSLRPTVADFIHVELGSDWSLENFDSYIHKHSRCTEDIIAQKWRAIEINSLTKNDLIKDGGYFIYKTYDTNDDYIFPLGKLTGHMLMNAVITYRHFIYLSEETVIKLILQFVKDCKQTRLISMIKKIANRFKESLAKLDYFNNQAKLKLQHMRVLEEALKKYCMEIQANLYEGSIKQHRAYMSPSNNMPDMIAYFTGDFTPSLELEEMTWIAKTNTYNPIVEIYRMLSDFMYRGDPKFPGYVDSNIALNSVNFDKHAIITIGEYSDQEIVDCLYYAAKAIRELEISL